MENKECWRLKNLIKDVEGTIALSLNETSWDYQEKKKFVSTMQMGYINFGEKN